MAWFFIIYYLPDKGEKDVNLAPHQFLQPHVIGGISLGDDGIRVGGELTELIQNHPQSLSRLIVSIVWCMDMVGKGISESRFFSSPDMPAI